MIKTLIAIAAIGLFSHTPAAEAKPVPCLAGMRKALIEGHFSGPLVCSRHYATFVLAGRTSRNRFSVYVYRYRFRPHGGAVMHGGQRIVVFHRGKYMGQYALSPPPVSTVTVKGTDVVVARTGKHEKDVLDFSRYPPRRVFLDEDDREFFR